MEIGGKVRATPPKSRRTVHCPHQHDTAAPSMPTTAAPGHMGGTFEKVPPPARRFGFTMPRLGD